MEEAFLVLLGNEVVRGFLESICVKVIAEILHRRATDPAFLASSDSAFSSFAAAKTSQEKTDALKTIQTLMASHS